MELTDIEELLKNMKIEKLIDTKDLDDANKIIKDFENRVFQCSPLLKYNSFVDDFIDAIKLFKGTSDLSLLHTYAKGVMNSYYALLGHGAIIYNNQNNDTELKHKMKEKDVEIEKLKKKVIFLKGRLAEWRKKYGIDDDNDTFESEVTDD